MDDIFISQKTFLEHIHHFRSCAIYSENSGAQADSVKSIHRWFSSLWEIIALMLSESQIKGKRDWGSAQNCVSSLNAEHPVLIVPH
jgi:hypothetical protein